jgi:hypothetical protein
VHLPGSIFNDLAIGVHFQQEPGTDAGDDTNLGPMFDDFFASNTWLTAAMAGVGVLLIAYILLRTIWQSKDEGGRRAAGSALRGLALAVILFVPSLIGKIADLTLTAVTSIADWFFGLF